MHVRCTERYFKDLKAGFELWKTKIANFKVILLHLSEIISLFPQTGTSNKGARQIPLTKRNLEDTGMRATGCFREDLFRKKLNKQERKLYLLLDNCKFVQVKQQEQVLERQVIERASRWHE